MVMKILIIIGFFFEIESKITRGHNFTLVTKQSRLDFPRGPSMFGIHYQQCVHASSVCSRI